MIKFLAGIKKNEDNIAFRIMDGDNSRNITYGRYYEEAEICAYNLRKIFGDIEGKKIGLYCDTSYEYLVMICSIIFSRAIAVPLNFRESIDNIKYEIDNAEIDLLIVDNDKLASLGSGYNVVEKTELFSDDGGRAELTDFSDEEQHMPSIIIYTSGTTGQPKGVVLSAGSLFRNEIPMFDSNSSFDGLEELRVYYNFPFYHIGGILGWIAHFEKRCVTYLSVSPGGALTDLENEEIDCAMVIPATLNLWKKAIERGHIERLGKLKLVITAGAPVDQKILGIFINNGISYGQYYGMSESGGHIAFNFDCKYHMRSVGKPAPMVEVTIEDGEICVKSPSVMLGYLNNDSETKEALVDGVLHTGDLGYIDEDGYVYITGRKKNLIILSGGENVSPEELERLVYKNKNVKECMAFEKNDRIHLAVYSDEAARDEIKSYVAELNKTLPIYKRIYGVDFQDKEFEKSASGKIKR